MCYVSIIIPTSNRIKLLERVLYSLNVQTRREFEVIIVDDGSNDGTPQFISSFQSAYSLHYVYLNKQEGNGASHSRNVGIDMAIGDVIIFLDSDSLVHENFVEEHYRFHQFHNNLAVVGIRWELFNEEVDIDIIKRGFTKSDLPVKNLEKQNRMFQFFSYNLSQYEVPWWFFSTSNASVRKNALLKVGKFDEEFGKHILYEDTEIAYRLYKNSTKFVLNANTECYHLYHEVDLKSKLELSKGNIEYFQKKYPDADEISFLDLVKESIPGKNEDHLWTKYIQAVNSSKKSLNSQCSTNYIIPVKDQWTDLKKYLEMLSNEESKYSRVIVIDMGSTDNTDINLQLFSCTFKLLYWPIKCRSIEEAYAIGRKKVLIGEVVNVEL